jgi:hypothetical protein
MQLMLMLSNAICVDVIVGNRIAMNSACECHRVLAWSQAS